MNLNIEALNEIFMKDDNDDDELSLSSFDTEISNFFVSSNHSSSTTNHDSLTMITTYVEQNDNDYDDIELHILKLHDPSIINMIEKQLCKVNGIKNVEINFATGNAKIKYDKNLLGGVRNIVEKVECLGFKCKLINNIKLNQLEYFTREKDILRWKKYFFYSLLFSLPIFIISNILPLLKFDHLELIRGLFLDDLISLLLSIPIQLSIIKIFFFGIFKVIKNRNFTKLKKFMVDILIIIVTLLTFIFSCISILYSILKRDSLYHPITMFDTSTMLITFVTLNHYLENLFKRKSFESITKLLSILPKTTKIIYINSNTGEVTGNKIIPTECLQLGDIVKISPGSIIPADGKVISGLSNINDSMITGDKSTKKVRRGDNVIGGSINGLGSFEMEITRVGNDTILSQIIKFVKDTQTIKAPIQLFAYKLMRYFIPLIMLLGILSFIFWEGSSISVLVIACPYALALSSSTAVMIGTDVGTKNGMLIKGGRMFEVGSKLTRVVFNKTGILTQGEFEVTHYEINNLSSSEITPKTFFKIIGAAESASEHPIGKAIVAYSKEYLKDEEYDIDISNFEYTTGNGIKCDVLLNTTSDLSFYDTSKIYNVLIGNMEFISQLYQIEIPQNALIIKEQQELLGKTTAFVAIDNEFIGLLFLSDLIKPEAKLTVDALKSMGLKVSMVTADQTLTAQYIASQCGIKDVHSQLSPKGKLNVIQSLQLSNEIVAMVGNIDDLNDFQALSKADVCISLTTSNTLNNKDYKLESLSSSADIILMNENLIDVISLMDLLRKLFKRIKYNIIYICFYNLLSLFVNMLLLLFGIYLHPILAGIFMSLISLSVLFSNLISLKSWEKPIWTKNFDGNIVKLENNKERTSLIEWFKSKRFSGNSREENENIIEL